MSDQALHDRVEGRVLDPFGYRDQVASRIGGLGGTEGSTDPTYAFHTHYVPVASGPARFQMRFHGLHARRGALVLRVHMLPDEPGSGIRLVNSTRIQLNRLVQHGGEVEIAFEGFRGYTFAVMGQVPDDTDAAADGLTVVLDRPGGPEEERTADAAPEDIRTTRFASETLRPIAELLAMTPPTLAEPVSQGCTPAQMRERDWAKWSETLGHPATRRPDASHWPAIYTLQVLQRYGLLEPEARGLLIDHDDAVADVLVARGVAVTTMGARHDEPHADERNVDWLCSAAALHGTGDARAVVAAVEDSLAWLRPGGLAVHLLPLAMEPGAPGMTRAELERLALGLISRRHEVAQIKPTGELARDTRGVAAFGLVLRRARSVI